MSFDQMFEVLDTLVLEENENVINVRPRFTPDPKGGFLVSDAAEYRVRHYSETGSLSWQFGRAGPGPEEFGLLRTALRGLDGNIIAVDLSRKLLFWNEESAEVVRVFPNVTDSSVEEIDLLPDGRLLISARYARGSAGLVQVFDPTNERVDVRFLSPYVPEFMQRGAAAAGWAASDVRADTVVSIYSWSDTLYLHGLDGRAFEKIPFPPTHFVKPEAGPDPSQRMSEWMPLYSRVQTVEWLPDGRFLVQYGGGTAGSANADPLPRYHLLLMDRHGRGIGDIVDGPQFRMRTPNGELYFADPSSFEANRLLKVHFNQEALR